MKRDIRLINLAVFLWGAGEGLFFYIQPLYIERLGASPSQIGGLLSLLGWIPALTHLPSGYLSDRLPRKTFMLGGWIAGLLGTLISALARDWRALIPGLVFYGLSGYCVPVFNAYLVTAAGGRNLERVLTTNSAAFTAGSVISPAIGGFVAETASMRVVYLAAAALFALSTVSVLHISPQHPSRRRDEHAGRKVLLRGRVLRFAVPTLLSFFSMYLVFPLAPNFLEDMRGLSTSLVGTLGSVYAVGTTVLSLAIGRFKGRHRRLALLVSQGLVWLSTGSLLWAPGPAGMTLSSCAAPTLPAAR
jgi:DHA1 family tetracycline resistance protein-like MFS transporter